MKEFVISEAKAETAVLVGLITQQQNEAKTKEYLDELEFLADTAGAITVKRFTQKVNGPSQTTYVGKGKLEEIKQYIKQCEDAADDYEQTLEAGECEAVENPPQPVGMVIFDDELSAKQIRNIEQELKVKILDRTTLILDIFAMRAQTANAKTQVPRPRWNWHNTVICFPVCKDFGLTWNVKAVARVPVAEREVWDSADLVKRSWKWTAVSFCSVSPCSNSDWWRLTNRRPRRERTADDSSVRLL